MNPNTDVANYLPWNHLTERFAQIGLLPHDVGGSGDWFFKSVSHQLSGYADLHTEMRMTGINHLQNHPELYIYSISDRLGKIISRECQYLELGVIMSLWKLLQMPSAV